MREIIEEERSYFCKIPCLEKKLKLRNDNAFFVFQRIPLKYIFFLKTTCVNSIFVNNSFVVISR